MLEAAWARHPEAGRLYQCWLGVAVSEPAKNGAEHSLSREKYLLVAKTFISLANPPSG